jgi:hypothetical protein
MKLTTQNVIVSPEEAEVINKLHDAWMRGYLVTGIPRCYLEVYQWAHNTFVQTPMWN